MGDREQTRIKPKIKGLYKTYTPEQANELRKLREAEARERERELNKKIAP